MDGGHKDYKADFKKYLIFLGVQVVLIIVLMIAESVIDDGEIFILEYIKFLGISVLFNILFVLLLLILLAVNSFKYESFTYVFLFVSVVMIIYMIRTGMEEGYDAIGIIAIIGIPMLCAGLFSRLVLWKYDKAVSGN